MREKNDALDLLSARAAELSRRAARGIPATSPFYTLAEQADFTAAVCRTGEGERLCFWGGYDDAERKKGFLFPDRLLPVPEGAEMPDLLSSFGNPLAVLRMTGSGYHALTNRDFLGAVLNLGVERDALGDLRTADDNTCYLVCDRPVAALLLGELHRVASDTVRITEIDFPTLWASLPEREFTPIRDTVPAARLDAVVGALCHLAREKAKDLVSGGAVQKMGRVVEKPDAPVGDGDVLSVRGYGKFRVISVSEENKKGRLRLSAEKYR